MQFGLGRDSQWGPFGGFFPGVKALMALKTAAGKTKRDAKKIDPPKTGLKNILALTVTAPDLIRHKNIT